MLSFLFYVSCVVPLYYIIDMAVLPPVTAPQTQDRGIAINGLDSTWQDKTSVTVLKLGRLIDPRSADTCCRKFHSVGSNASFSPICCPSETVRSSMSVCGNANLIVTSYGPYSWTDPVMPCTVVGIKDQMDVTE